MRTALFLLAHTAATCLAGFLLTGACFLILARSTLADSRTRLAVLHQHVWWQVPLAWSVCSIAVAIPVWIAVWVQRGDSVYLLWWPPITWFALVLLLVGIYRYVLPPEVVNRDAWGIAAIVADVHVVVYVVVQYTLMASSPFWLPGPSP